MSRIPQSVEIIESATVRLRPGGGERIGRGIRASEPEDLMTRAKELGDDGGTNPSGRAGDEYTHDKPPGRQTMTVTAISIAVDVSRCRR